MCSSLKVEPPAFKSDKGLDFDWLDHSSVTQFQLTQVDSRGTVYGRLKDHQVLESSGENYAVYVPLYSEIKV